MYREEDPRIEETAGAPGAPIWSETTSPEPAASTEPSAVAATAVPDDEPGVEDAPRPATARPLLGGSRNPTRRRRRPFAGAIVGVAILSSVLSTGVTYGALTALEHNTTPAATVTSAGTGTSSTTLTSATSAGSQSIVAAVAKASPSVVTITTQTTATGRFGTTQPAEGVGSGIVFSSDGFILTNKHVVSGASSLTVTLSNGKTYSGTVYGVSSTTDLAIVKIDATGLTAATIGDSTSLTVGQDVVAIGDPLGEFSGSVTTGIVSGLNRSIDVESESLSGLIQTDTAVNPGNSGGPLLDLNGNVVGIVTASSSSAQGISFAIPVSAAKPMMSAALAGQQV